MLLRFDFRPDSFDFAIAADQEGHAMDPLIFPAHKLFLAPNAIGFHDLAVFVGQKREGQLVLLDELVELVVARDNL